jgi:2-desacetyl-2-hydroxyethyl bacteriochlorophyllide A dehydrogenase
MQTVVLEQPGQFRLGQAPEPGPPGRGEALVRIRRVGVCGTDLHAFRGKQPFFSYPRIVGHELGVEVVAAAGTGLAQGDRCAVQPYLHCGTCLPCRRGKTNCCIRLQTLGVHVDGGMQEFLCLPAAALHPSPRLSLDELALVEMLTIGAHAVRRAELQPGEATLVIGAGPIGLSTAAMARLCGARVLLLDVSEPRREMAARVLPGVACLDAGGEASARLEAFGNGDLPTAVFDATGNPQSMMRAVELVCHGGKLIFVSLVQADLTFHDPEMHRRELTLLRSRNATAADFRWVLDSLEQSRLDVRPWITHRAAAADTPAAFPGWLDPARGVLKAIVEFGAGGRP